MSYASYKKSSPPLTSLMSIYYSAYNIHELEQHVGEKQCHNYNCKCKSIPFNQFWTNTKDWYNWSSEANLYHFQLKSKQFWFVRILATGQWREITEIEVKDKWKWIDSLKHMYRDQKLLSVAADKGDRYTMTLIALYISINKYLYI